MLIDEVTKIDSFNVLENVTTEIAIAARKSFLKKQTTGGIVLGQVAKNVANVMKISEQKKKGDEEHPFTRTKEHANKAIARWFKQSEGRTVYLGEWCSVLNFRLRDKTVSQMGYNLLNSVKTDELNVDTLLGIVAYPGVASEVKIDVVLAGGEHCSSTGAVRRVVFKFKPDSAELISSELVELADCMQ